MHLEQDDKILFLGGLNTDAGRSRDDYDDVGKGYAMITAAALSAKFPDLNLSFINRGQAKDNTEEMMHSLKDKCLLQRPNVVIIFLGHQDALLAEQQHEQASIKEYSRYNRILRKLVEEIQFNTTRRIILLEPFLLDNNNLNRALRSDINQKIQITREIARDYRCDFIALDGLMNELAIKNGYAAYIEEDGITYKPATHHIIASRLIEQFDTD